MNTELTAAERAAFDQEEAIADNLVAALFAKSGRQDADAIGVSYSVLLHMVHFLFECGWDLDELQGDIAEHKAIHDKWEAEETDEHGPDAENPTVPNLRLRLDEPEPDDHAEDDNDGPEAIAQEALDGLFEMAEERDACPACAADLLFVKLIHLLKDTGTSAAEMQQMVVWHTADDAGPKQ